MLLSFHPFLRLKNQFSIDKKEKKEEARIERKRRKEEEEEKTGENDEGNTCPLVFE